MSPERPLHVRAEARPVDVGTLRRAVRHWLTEVLADPDVAEDLTLAVSEALENAVDHAFVGREPGTMSVVGSIEGEKVVIAVSDDGAWQEPAPGPTTRGRGLALMQSLTERAVLDSGAGGTSVTLIRHR